MLKFEWNADKADNNLKKHGVGFEEAARAFADPLSITIPDPDHSEDEDRFILLGQGSTGRLLVVVHIEIGDTIRIISARLATAHERRDYENG